MSVLPRFVACWAVSFSAVYLLAAFVMWDFNPANWGEFSRGAAAAAALFTALPAIIFAQPTESASA